MLYFGRQSSHSTTNRNLSTVQDERPAKDITSSTPVISKPYEPTIEDVLGVKEILLKQSELPLELLDAIIDLAEFWPHTTSIKSLPPMTIRAGGEHENQFVVRSYPLGLVPDLQQRSEHQITDQDVEKLPILAPKPWDLDRTVPHEATQEVIHNLAQLSTARGKFPCRKVVFTIVSRDQGWGGDPDSRNSYEGSFSWFDVGKEELSAFREAVMLESWELAPWPQFRLDTRKDQGGESADSSTSSNSRPLVCSLRTILPPVFKAEGENNLPSNPIYKFKHDLIPSDSCLQKNIVANRESREHSITWSYLDNIDPDSEEGNALENQGRGRATALGNFVGSLKLGETVTVWAKARFPGWSNSVEEIKIDVYWAV